MFKALCIKTSFSRKGGQLLEDPSYIKGNVYDFNEGTPIIESMGYHFDDDYECPRNEIGELSVMRRDFFDEHFVKVDE